MTGGMSMPKTVLLMLGCVLLSSLIHTGLIYQAGFSWTQAITDAALSQAIVSLAMIGIILMMRYYRPGRKNFLMLLEWTLVMAGVVFFIQQYALRQLESDEVYNSFLRQTWVIRAVIDWLILVIATLAGWLLYYWTDQQESETRREQADRLARETELAALRQQLQPHFLFNSLNSISALAVSRPEEARRMVQQLSDFLRGTLKRDDHTMVTLDEEIQHLKLYLEIEKVRFGHRLGVEIFSGDGTLPLKLPSLLLQPVVENAIKFGLYDTIGEITIKIHTNTVGGMLQVEVTNPYDPATAVPQKGTGFGLSSLRRRLYLLFSRNDLLEVRQTGNEFTTILRIPQ